METSKDPRPYQWVACSTTEFGHTGRNRHLARVGALTTYCGHSASVEGIWRKNSTKPPCQTCMKAESKVLNSGN